MSIDSLRPGGDMREVYELYGSMLFKIAMVYLGNKQDVEEALQETFIKWMHKSPDFRDQEHQKAWLIRVITNHCKNMQGSLWRRRVTKLEQMDDYFEEASERLLMDHVMSLPFKYKSVIHLFYYEDYSVREIAGILQISESAVKMRLQRGRKLLRMDLEGEEWA
ncbi:RNA polymerase sigma factor [Paenibacillus sp. JCM 10914]|uniref:RNA polymerase sigma factor n=1 Tax=Paenibacillus sp. JCM 10914 TaxID=1236974 RepID=UPI0003CC583F|nr:sigma-70 family RNA polymerase sigma factor [Paenibacillus sp. JCM 10914]GAE05939.1 RNA polymerase sigma-70 factor, ECF subfamily [Paenibacillus sp. JCM 10914]